MRTINKFINIVIAAGLAVLAIEVIIGIGANVYKMVDNYYVSQHTEIVSVNDQFVDSYIDTPVFCDSNGVDDYSCRAMQTKVTIESKHLNGDIETNYEYGDVYYEPLVTIK
jgi:hypothetical protein